MTLSPRQFLVCVMTAAAACVLGACGTSEDQQVRAVVKEYQKPEKDAGRVCSRMTSRAQAQITAYIGTFAGAGDCQTIIGTLEPQEDVPTPREIDSAKLAVRDDHAVLVFRDSEKVGLRKVDGTWKLDNIINPTLDEKPRRSDPRLTSGTDEQQLRATFQAVSDAFAARDYERGCELFSYGAEAQLIVGRLFAELSGAKSSGRASDLSCAASMRVFAQVDGAATGLGPAVVSAAKLAEADISVRGPHATVKIGGEKRSQFVREEGRWLVGPSPESLAFDAPPTPRSLARCWRRAGATIASHADDLRFAAGDTARGMTVNPGYTSVKGDNWRIFYAHAETDPGLRHVVADPRSVPVAAFITNAGARSRVVSRARACD